MMYGIIIRNTLEKRDIGMSKVLLYSGGTDSWLIDKLWKPDIKLYININGMYSQEEIKRLPSDVKVIDFPFLGTIEDRNNLNVPLRNLYFLMIASNFGDEICLGATLGDRGGIDNRFEIIYMLENILKIFNSNIHIENKYIFKNKYEILEEYINKGGTIKEFIENTFSCYNPIDGKECYKCKPCYRKFLLGYYYGYTYNETVKINMINYIKKEVIPLNKNKSTYFTDRVGEGKYTEKAVDKLFKEYSMNWRDYQ